MRTELGVCRLSMGHLFDRAIYLHPNPTASLKAQQFSTDLKKNGINQMPWWKAADFGDPDTVVTVVTVVQDGSGDFVTLLLTSIALVLAVLRFKTPSSYARNSATWILDQL